MSYCNPCAEAYNLPSCMTNLTVGTFASNINASVYIYLKNHTTNHTIRYSATTAAITGLLTFDITSGGTFIPVPDHDYELFVVLQSATNNDTRLTFTVNAVNYTCAALRFETIWGTDGDVESYTNQTLKF